MIELLEIAQNTIELGLIYALVVMAVYLTSRVIHFDDLTVEGSFATGGAITALCLTNHLPPLLTIPICLIIGGCVGLGTGALHTTLGINNLVSGLIVTTAMFSINLKTAGSNVSFAATPTLFSSLNTHVGTLGTSIAIVPLCLMFLMLLKWFLQTEIGFLLKAVGCNQQMLTNLGKNIHTYKIIGLAVANALTALAGSLFVQYTGFFSITGSIGTFIIALAGLMLGEIIKKGLGVGLLIGSIVYQSIFAITIGLNMDPVWNKLITACIMILLLMLQRRDH